MSEEVKTSVPDEDLCPCGCGIPLDDFCMCGCEDHRDLHDEKIPDLQTELNEISGVNKELIG